MVSNQSVINRYSKVDDDQIDKAIPYKDKIPIETASVCPTPPSIKFLVTIFEEVFLKKVALKYLIYTSKITILISKIYLVIKPIKIVVNNQLRTVRNIPLSFRRISSGFSAV